ncbi:acetyl-CoA carboxylase biotin carboxylase subunit [Aquabacter cavernae]|uniref:acetyl-CoA carboxylase biotin carboxylase subunit n=1 Tax=Aquabacter cavernae TaxID=2496029 RepID=UPI000F8C3ABC|nr:biotin carboxylase N-terminal domain-containing protein [Aquabacter cavernae]
MRRVLIANRGEIACRVIRAAKQLGKQTIAVYSEADADALHVQLADMAVPIGPPPAARSYLDAQRVLEAAHSHGAEGVHPGYGFLSESADFARAVEEAGLIWIGPSADCISRMGDKNRAREIAQACGVPVLPGSGRVETGDVDTLADMGAQVGFPLLVKAIAGGGGIGMQRVDQPEALASTVTKAQALAQKAFGDGGVYLERFVPKARHIEIQVFGFGDGTAIHLFERDCSIQRRFQKIIEESPAPGLPDSVLERMCAAAVAIACHQRYSGPGTVEFLVDAASFAFFFLEMNTRIQVEHGVTEMVTGRDLVEMQIRQAEGTLAPLAQADIVRRGCAVECRIYAENPAKSFMPAPGVLDVCSFPPQVANLRVDTGVRQGDRITPFYDPMIAKMIAWDETRPQAFERLLAALGEARVEGIHTNIPFLTRLLRHPALCAGQLDTLLVTRELGTLLGDAAGRDAGAA